jgi:hypothetical protein
LPRDFSVRSRPPTKRRDIPQRRLVSDSSGKELHHERGEWR